MTLHRTWRKESFAVGAGSQRTGSPASFNCFTVLVETLNLGRPQDGNLNYKFLLIFPVPRSNVGPGEQQPTVSQDDIVTACEPTYLVLE
jgi:hypothetical protein